MQEGKRETEIEYDADAKCWHGVKLLCYKITISISKMNIKLQNF